jgi:hypothetical protein
MKKIRILICDSRLGVVQFLKTSLANENVDILCAIHGGTPAVVCMAHQGPFDLFYINVKEKDVRHDFIHIANLFIEKFPKGRVVFMFDDYDQGGDCYKDIEIKFKGTDFDILKIPIFFFSDIVGHIGMIRSDRIADYVMESQQKRLQELNS